MKKFLMAAAICSFSAPAMATYFNATFDCGRGRTVWIGNPAVGHGEERSRKVIFEITISHFNFDKTPVMRSPIVQWNVDTNKVTLDGRRCRETHENADKNGEDH
jgi:hypothetical protein